jgi:hypothetical protein
LKVKEIVEASLLYVGVPAITLYPLGFVALGLQMWRDPFFPYDDFGTIWDAVSLVGHTEVIGTGVELLYLSVISTLLGVGVASVIFHFFRRGPSIEEKHEGWGLWGPYLLVLLPVAVILAYNSVPLDGWEDAPYVAGFLVFSIGGGILIGYTRLRHLDHLFLTGLAIAYAGSLLAALCIAPLDVPNLPLVHTDARVGGVEGPCAGQPDKTFVKLDESATHWHVYNKSGLYSIPYEDVKYARYYEDDCPALRDI